MRRRKYQTGGFNSNWSGSPYMQLGSIAGNSIIDAIEGGKQTSAGTIGKSILSGAGAGAMFGPLGAGIGAGYGAITGIINNNKRKDAEEERKRLEAEQRSREDINRKQLLISNSNSILNEFPTEGIANNGFAYGGIKNSKMPYPIDNSSKKQLSTDAAVYDGKKHENGGIKLEDGSEIEDNEVIQKQKVYSDRLNPSESILNDIKSLGFSFKIGDTFASLSERLLKKKGEFESKYSVGPNTTSDVMINRIDSALDLIFEDQQLQNGNSNGESMKRKYQNGGEKPYKKIYTPLSADKARIPLESDEKLIANELNAKTLGKGMSNALRTGNDITYGLQPDLNKRNIGLPHTDFRNEGDSLVTSENYLKTLLNKNTIIPNEMGVDTTFTPNSNFVGGVFTKYRDNDSNELMLELKDIITKEREKKEFTPEPVMQYAGDGPKKSGKVYLNTGKKIYQNGGFKTQLTDTKWINDPITGKLIDTTVRNNFDMLTEQAQPSVSNNMNLDFLKNINVGTAANIAGTMYNSSIINKMNTNTPYRNISKLGAPAFNYRDLSGIGLSANERELANANLNLSRSGGDNPASRAALLASKLQADSQVRGQEVGRYDMIKRDFLNRKDSINAQNANIEGQNVQNAIQTDNLNLNRSNEKLGLKQGNIDNLIRGIIGQKTQTDLMNLDKEKFNTLNLLSGKRGVSERLLKLMEQNPEIFKSLLQ